MQVISGKKYDAGTAHCVQKLDEVAKPNHGNSLSSVLRRISEPLLNGILRHLITFESN